MTSEVDPVETQVSSAYVPVADDDGAAQVLALAQLMFNFHGNLNLLETAEGVDSATDDERDQFILKGIYNQLLAVIP